MDVPEASPSVATLLAPLLARLPRDQVPLFLALAERRAAERYRHWATAATDDDTRARLRQCADREEEIACRVESLFDDAAAITAAIEQQIPDLADLILTAFDGLPLRGQLALQAEGERLGAATWRSLAAKTPDPAAGQTLPRCAELEEQSAEVLEALLAATTWPFDAA